MNYWLKNNRWDKAPRDFREIVKKLNTYKPEEVIDLFQRQFAHTYEPKNSNVYGNYDVSDIPSTTEEIWKWLKTGKGHMSYSRPKEKTGLYTGDLEISEKVPAQCMTIRLPIGSAFKVFDIPVRYRAGACPTKDEEGNPKLFGHMILECFLDGEWKLIDPREPYRIIDPQKLTYPKKKYLEFLTSYRAIELAGKDIPLEMFESHTGKYKGKQQLIKIITDDFLNLANEPIVPWKVATYYQGLSIGDSKIVEKYDEIVDELYPVLKNPEPSELERIKKEKIVSYKLI